VTKDWLPWIGLFLTILAAAASLYARLMVLEYKVDAIDQAVTAIYQGAQEP